MLVDLSASYLRFISLDCPLDSVRIDVMRFCRERTKELMDEARAAKTLKERRRIWRVAQWAINESLPEHTGKLSRLGACAERLGRNDLLKGFAIFLNFHEAGYRLLIERIALFETIRRRVPYPQKLIWSSHLGSEITSLVRIADWRQMQASQNGKPIDMSVRDDISTQLKFRPPVFKLADRISWDFHGSAEFFGKVVEIEQKHAEAPESEEIRPVKRIDIRKSLAWVFSHISEFSDLLGFMKAETNADAEMDRVHLVVDYLRESAPDFKSLAEGWGKGSMTSSSRTWEISDITHISRLVHRYVSSCRACVLASHKRDEKRLRTAFKHLVQMATELSPVNIDVQDRDKLFALLRSG